MNTELSFYEYIYDEITRKRNYRCKWTWNYPSMYTVYQWCEFKSRRGKKKHLSAQRSNSNTVWFNFQTSENIHI